MRLAFALFAVTTSAATQPVSPLPTSVDRAAEQRLHQDWAWQSRYRDANAMLAPSPGRPRIVLIGDSITQGWYDLDPGFFTPGRIGRGIGGQTTSQMLLRFRQDVIDLSPDAVQIMAGTNDIAGNTGPMTDTQTEGNIRSMVELAQAHGIRVVLASIPPADLYPWKPGLETGQHIVRLNMWLRHYAAATGSTYADYWSALRGAGLGMRDGLAKDHVHPTMAGYLIMNAVAEVAFKEALSHAAPEPLAAAKVP